MNLKDDNLDDVFKNMIIQTNNYNSNSDLFIYNDKVLKVYNDEELIKKYNLDIISRIFKYYKYLKEINELVLPTDLLYYNKFIVGFSMPYIKGNSLDEVIENKKLTDNEIYIIFLGLLDLIKKTEKLPFSFAIGDMHEKNVIISDKYLFPNIIDCDSFIINNKKLKIDKEYIIGKYINSHYKQKDIKKIDSSADYFCLLCMILNYLYKDVIELPNDPVKCLREDEQFENLYDIFDRCNDLKTFKLTENDIDRLFNYSYILNYFEKDKYGLQDAIKRIRKLY